MKEIISRIAEQEGVDTGFIEQGLSSGTIVVPLNRKRTGIEIPVAIGKGLTVKINANIGGSPDICDAGTEREKLRTAVRYGADTVMDLTIGPSWKDILAGVLENSPVPVGTVPVYGAICIKDRVSDLDGNDFLDVIRTQAEMGVDFMTIHVGVNRETAQIYDGTGRTGGIVSRGGKLMYRWMKARGQENPLYERFDEVMDIAKEHNVTLSLGDGFRPGCLADASDNAQFAELRELGRLVRRCRDSGVSVMIEGPGHVPLDMIEENVVKEKQLCDGAPFYILGPLVTDIAAGHDHIAGAIGGAFAAWKGADFLCYLTPAEHLHLPDIDDVYEGVLASKIAAHAADVAKGLQGARKRDDMMSEARRRLDWAKMEKQALDPDIIGRIKKEYPERLDRACTMCGEYCALLEDEDT